jgi:acetyltransferase-like isoleucine patch superfamily enzyme
MAYLDPDRLRAMGFKSLGANVKISEKASIFDAGSIDIGDNSRIDDFCVISGNISIGRYCHITPMCLIAGGEPGVSLADFCTLAYGVKIFAQSDDYSGTTMTNSLIPRRFKRETFKPVRIGRHVIIGSGAVVFPGADIGEGCAIGAMALLTRPADPWGIYVGIPARRLKDRKRDLLELEKLFCGEIAKNSI